MNSLYTLSNVAATEQLALTLSQCVIKQVSTVIYLEGDLGAGKTTFSKGFIQGCGYNGKVKSPTFTLLEYYQIETVTIYHFDLYRLADAEELEYLGIRDYLEKPAIWLIEWPERGRGILPKADIHISIDYHLQDEAMRIMTIAARSETGVHIMQLLDK